MRYISCAFTNLMAVPDPITSVGHIAEIVDWGTDRDEYAAGDAPRAYVEIRNTGSHAINEAVAKITVARKTTIGSITLIRDKEFKASTFLPGFDVPPGKSRRFEISPFQIPNTSLAKGTYELMADIIVGNRTIATLRKTIKVK